MTFTREDVEAWSDGVMARPIWPLTPPVLEAGSVLRFDMRPAGWLTSPRLPAAPEDTLRWLDRGDPDEPTSQCGALRLLRLAPTTDELLTYLHRRADTSGANPYVRLAATHALHAHDPTGAIARATELAADDDPSIRVAATATLRLFTRLVHGRRPDHQPGKPGP